MADNSIPSIRTFQMDASTVGVLKNSVNLFRGDVNYTQKLFSMPGRTDKDGLQIDVSIQYQSNIHRQATTWNREAPTGVLGLGWSLPLSVISIDPDSFPAPSYSIQAAGVSSSMVREPDSILFPLDKSIQGQLLADQPVSADLRNAFIGRGLPLSVNAIVTEQGSTWVIRDDGLEQLFQLKLSQDGSTLEVYDGGESYQLVNYKFWRVHYYPLYERWAVTNESGLNMSFGGGVSDTSQQNGISLGNSIEWGVQWVNASGKPIWRGNSAVTQGQAQYARVWHLVKAYSRFGEYISYGYNEFTRDSGGLLQNAEQCVGQGGKPYTKACYLTSITDVFGRQAIFNYKQKQWDNTSTESPKEYADPHKAFPDSSSNGFQDCYETLYIDNIVVLHKDESTLFTLKFFYCPSPEVIGAEAVANVSGNTSGDFYKRYLTGFKLFNPAGECLPGYSFDYYLSADQPNPGALRSITWPTGGTALYTYKAAELGNCARTATLTPPANMPAKPTPRVWFGSDYAVVLWYSSSGKGSLSMQIITWNGKWQTWQADPEKPFLIDGTVIDLSSLHVTTGDDFVAITYDINTDTTNMHLFQKNPACPAQWKAADIPGGGSGGCNNPTWHWYQKNGTVQIQAGRSFVVASQMCDSQYTGSYDLFTWDWTTARWEHSDGNSKKYSYSYVTVGPDYILTVDLFRDETCEKVETFKTSATLRYLPSLGGWQTTEAVDLNFTLNDFESLALSGGKSMVAVSHLVSGSPQAGWQEYDVYLLQWNDAYALAAPVPFSFMDSVDSENPTTWTPTIIDDSLVAVAGNLIRFDGSRWKANSNLMSSPLEIGWQQRYAYGPDFAVRVYAGSGQATAKLVSYDANSISSEWNSAVTEITDLTNSDSNVYMDIWPSAGNSEYLTVGNKLFFRGTETNWANAVSTSTSDMQILLNQKESPDDSERYQLNTASMINEGPSFLACAVYDNIKSSEGQTTDTTAMVLRNGNIENISDLLTGNKMNTGDMYGDYEQGTFPGGSSVFVTYLSSSDFDAAEEIYLNRYAGDSIKKPISDWPVCSVTIDDGLSESSTTSYVQDTETAMCDAEGNVVKYYTSTVYPGGSPDNPVYGRVVSCYLNGNETSCENYYNMLDGMLKSVTAYDAQGTCLQKLDNTWKGYVKRAGSPCDISAAPQQLYGAYVLQTAKQIIKDGVSSQTETSYVPDGFEFTFTGQPAAVSTTVFKIEAQSDAQAEENVQRNTYACEVNEASLVLNDLTSTVQQTNCQAGTTISSSVTALTSWPTVWGQDVCVPAEEADFGWIGGSYEFPFQTYMQGQSPENFQLTTRILKRDCSGNVSEQKDGAETYMSTIFGTSLGFPVAVFKGAALAECAWNGFQNYEDLNGWELVQTEICTTQALLGTQCLSVPQGAAVSIAVFPAPDRTKYLLGFRYKTIGKYTDTTSGWTITAGASTQTIPFKDTEGQWRYSAEAVDVPASTASISLKGINQSTADILLDGVLLVPFGTDVTIQSWYADTRLLHGTMNASGAINFTLYDAFSRTLGAVGPDNNLQEIDISFLSRQGSLSDSFDNSNPNAELTLQMSEGGISETFMDAGNWMSRWTPGDSSLWQAKAGMLYKASDTPDVLTWSGDIDEEAVFFIEFIQPEVISGSISVMFGGGQTIGWDPKLGWNWLNADGSVIQVPLAAPPYMAGQWLLLIKAELLLFIADGQLLFSSNTGIPKGSFQFCPGSNMLQINHLIYGKSPRLGISYNDGAARQRQIQQLCGSDSRIMEIIYDALDRQVANTRVAMGSFGTGETIPVMRFRTTFVNVPAFLASMQDTWQMTGDAADYYRGQSEGYTNRSDDQGYPYTGLRYEASAKGRIIESGKPGKTLAIHDINTTTSAERNTSRTSYTASAPDDPLPAEKFYEQNITTPGGSIGRLFTDTANRAVLMQQKDTAGNMSGQTQSVLSYSDASDNIGTMVALQLPNYFSETPAAQNFVRNTLQNPVGQVTCCSDPDTGSIRYIFDGKGLPRFILTATEPDEQYYLYTRYDLLGRIIEEGSVNHAWDENLLKTKVNDINFPGSSDGAIPARKYIYDGDGTDPNSLGHMVQVITFNPVSDPCTVTESWTYDVQGRVITAGLDISGAVTHSARIAYHYNNLNQIIKVDLPNGSPVTAITYSYDDQGNNTEIGIPGDSKALAAYTWDADGHLLTMTRGSLLDSWGYDSTGNILLHQVEADSKTLFSQNYNYTYDGHVDSRQTLSNLGQTQIQKNVKYTYDGQQRLMSAIVDNAMPGNQVITEYDPNGNILAGSQDDKPFSMTCTDGTNRLSGAAFSDNTTMDFQYRNDGCPSKWRGLAVNYDLALEMAAEISNAAKTVRYARGLNNHRAVRKSGDDLTITMQGAGNTPIAMWVNGQVQVCIWGPNGLVGIHNGNYQAAVSDHQHTVWGVADSSGNALAAFDYLPFGGMLSRSGSIADTWQFTYAGKYWETELGLYDFGARLYDPSLMRFISPDPARQYASPYIFAGNNPINLMDPSGNISVWAQVGIGIAMAAVAVAGIALTVLTEGLFAEPTAGAEVALGGVAIGGEASETGIEMAVVGGAEVAAAEGTAAAAGEVVAGAAAEAEAGVALTTATKAAAKNIAYLATKAVCGAITSAGTSGLKYDIKHGRDFTAKGFFEAMGVGALTGAVGSAISGIASMPAMSGLTKGMGATSKVMFMTFAQSTARMAGNDVSTLINDAVTNQKVTVSQLLLSSAKGFCSGAVLGGCGATKSLSPESSAITASDRALVKASILLNRAADYAKSLASSQAAYASYVAGGLFLCGGYTLWGIYENTKK